MLCFDGLGQSSRAIALVLACALVSSCGASLPPVPSKGGPRWLELQTEHFVLFTEQREQAARDTSARLEQLFDALLDSAPRRSDLPSIKLRVVVFDDFHQIGLFFPTKETRSSELTSISTTSRLFEPLFVTERYVGADSWRNLSHTLTHIIYGETVGTMPAWLSEGLARYYQNSAFDGDSLRFGTVYDRVTGHHSRRQPYTSLFSEYGRIRTAELQSASDVSQPPNVTASAWLLVDYLLSKRNADFRSFLAALASGKSATEAWATTLGDLSPERLDGLLDAYWRGGEFPVVSQRVSASRALPRLRALRDADVYTLRAELRFACSDCGTESERAARRDLQEALRSDPSHLRAAALLATGSAGHPPPSAATIASARAWAKTQPGDWLAWLPLAIDETRSGSAAKRCDDDVVPQLSALAPAEPYAVLLESLCELRAHHWRSALELSGDAASKWSYEAPILLRHAALLSSFGQCDELRSVLQRLPSTSHGAITPERLRALQACTPRPRP